jgi:predicted lipid-binding transport protein (Tim44 family)
MRVTLVLTIVALTTGVATSAFAQGETRNPPSPNAGNSSPTPPNSVPAGSLTVNPSASGGGSPTIGTQSGTTGTAQPAAPSGSTQNDPSGAFQQTVPKPAQ